MPARSSPARQSARRPGNAAITYAAGSTIAPVTFGYTITNSSNAADTQSASNNKSTAFTVNVGNAVADNNGQGANGASPVRRCDDR